LGGNDFEGGWGIGGWCEKWLVWGEVFLGVSEVLLWV
jgi:hypothetical protein